ncbi:DUF6268 family outer membrane beta-barrel protein [Blastopirellula sp. JC732]|uniref:DUF6268 family outer membrane beta-barrel protein n=1 Tax=Blastopirellula sediminis TaxID=2894196 RepID=A0A9X1MR81_9BACT|nr:DUF6268 family outer membrane beta-barrel protein [Blastopirellula sediminis]MCC9605810.1 DUF6268 family outer membrane beta-barrel protein [Blastopirellula sediminis]MCC9630890.1 DUF6268 family outer membrane beta-barrel protein [Blastopirellula sediminis]
MNRRVFVLLLLAVCALGRQQFAAAQSFDPFAEPAPAEQAGYFDQNPQVMPPAEYVPWSQSYQTPSPYQEVVYPHPEDPQTELFQEEMYFLEDEVKKPVKKGLDIKKRDPLKTYVFWAPEQNLRGQNGDFAMSGFNIALTLPISMEEGRIWAANISYDQLDIVSDAFLPDTGIEIPDHFYQVNFGVTHMRLLANGWQAGGNLTVGTATNKPFDAIDDMTLSALAFVNVPVGDGRDSWNFSLFYSPTSQLPYPLPGIAYLWRPSEQFEMNIGLPFALKYRPTEQRTFSLTYTPLTNINILLEQELGAKVVVYGGYSVNNKIYLLSERLDNNDRFYFFDQRLTIGLKRDLFWGFSADLSAAYLFDRKVFQAQGFSSDRIDQFGIDPGGLISLSVSWSR